MENNKLFLKNISNNVNYAINKKIKNLEEKIDETNKNMKIIIELLKNNNLNKSSFEIYDVKKIACDEEIEKKIMMNEYKNIKRETFLIEISFIKDCLEMGSLSGDIKMFKRMYIDNVSKEFYPIRHIRKKIQYWNNNCMNDDDSDGTYIKNTIIKNIEDCYLIQNIFDNYTGNTEQFFKNQEHINKLSDEKYKDKILSKIINIITI